MVTIDLKSIGSRIQTTRKNRGLTQEDLAAMVDLSATHISVIERGVKPPKLETFIHIANALNVSADSLLVNVVENSAEGIAYEFSESISKLSSKDKEKVLMIVQIMAEL